jgi:hypothetical protein
MAKRQPTFSESLIVARNRGATSEAPNLWNGLVSNYDCLQGGGSTLYDIAGGNHLALTIDASADWKVNEYGHYVDMAVTTKYMHGGTWPDVADSGSIVMRMNWDFASTIKYAITHYASNRIYLQQAGSLWKYRLGNSALQSTGVATAADRWDHVALTWDGSTARFYFNGTEEHNSAYIGLTTLANDLYIGSLNGGVLGGLRVANAAVWNRALTPSEIQQLYEDPHAMHRLRPVSVAFVDAGGAPSASIAPAAYHQAQMAGAL